MKSTWMYGGGLLFGIAGALVLCAGAAEAAEVTFESLLGEMTDLDTLADFPDPAFTCKQFSSYDRASQDRNVLTDGDWFANGDRGKHLRAEKRNGADEWVLMDAEGPGAVVRFWSANANDAGVVRVYLDGAADPVIEMPLQDMLNGQDAPFLGGIAGVRSRGWNSHYPIPYAKHCKITTDKPDFYYQINYRTYEEGAQVETYTAEMAEKYKKLIAKTAERLVHCSEPDLPKKVNETGRDGVIVPGQAFDLKIEGAGAIYRIAGKAKAGNLETALRGCLLEIFFDGRKGASVMAPLGDFFGTAPGANAYESLCSGVLGDGTLYSHWVMPYQKSAELRITNYTKDPVSVGFAVTTAAREWGERTMYFNAKWRAEFGIPTRPRQDWTYLSCGGKGRFVGDMLHVKNDVKHWWGEGDEKIYVDGETFPSHFGTGTEDYYGYAWCFNVPFTHAYHNQPRCDGPGNYGHTCVSRYHILDNIPFTKSFRFDMEVWHWADCEVDMAATSYWYAMPQGVDFFSRPRPETLIIVEPKPLPLPKQVKGALEGEKLRVISHSGGGFSNQDQGDSDWDWSSGVQLWWRDGKPGDTLSIAFPAAEAGSYEVLGRFTKAADYGIMQLYINGKKAGDPIDFFNKGVVATPEMSLGVHALKAGENELKVEIVGANDKSSPKAHMFGLDYVMLKPAK